MVGGGGVIDGGGAEGTKQYKAAAGGWREGRRRRYDGLERAMGKAALAEKIDEGERTLASLKDGLLRRSLLTARRPA